MCCVTALFIDVVDVTDSRPPPSHIPLTPCTFNPRRPHPYTAIEIAEVASRHPLVKRLHHTAPSLHSYIGKTATVADPRRAVTSGSA